MLKKIKLYFNPKIKVKKSSIHSKGVFAKKNIKKGEFIIEYSGRKINHDESEKLYEQMIQEHKKNPNKASVYTFTLNETTDIDGNTWYNKAKYINHSCKENCEALLNEEEQTIEIHATKNIKKGEELFFNYGYDVENWQDHPCYCGSKNCVGHIVSKDQWAILEELKKEED